MIFNSTVMKNVLTGIFLIIISSSFLKVYGDTEKRETSPFNEISLLITAELYIEQGDEYSIEVTAKPQTLYKLIADIDDERMIIRYSFHDMWFSNFEPGPVSIKVITPDIDRLSITGSGNIIAEKPIETRHLDLYITGSGDINIANLNCKSIEAIIAGTGDIILAGNDTLTELNVIIAGSGNMRANLIPARFGSIKIGGTGNCNVNVSEYLNAWVLGSGNITYSGSPEINSTITGSGNINKRD